MRIILLFIVLVICSSSCRKFTPAPVATQAPAADTELSKTTNEYIGTYTFRYGFGCDPCGSVFDTIFSMPFKVSATIINDSICFSTGFPATFFKYSITCHGPVNIQYGNIPENRWMLAGSNIYTKDGERIALNGDSLNYHKGIAFRYPKLLRGGHVMDLGTCDASFRGVKKPRR